jgi:hypothetical protein
MCNKSGDIKAKRRLHHSVIEGAVIFLDLYLQGVKFLLEKSSYNKLVNTKILLSARLHY